MPAPDCYKCKHRRDLIGDAHSWCTHPKTVQCDNQFTALIATMTNQNIRAARELNIEGHRHGIKNGWFIWPANFDPVWLLNCDGFEPTNP